MRSLIGYFAFGSPDAALLVSLLPRLVHVRGEKRLATLVELVREESRNQLPARDVVLARLLEGVMIEALRSTAGTTASRGLLRGLADERLADDLPRMHEEPTKTWMVEQLAKVALFSRSAFSCASIVPSVNGLGTYLCFICQTAPVPVHGEMRCRFTHATLQMLRHVSMCLKSFCPSYAFLPKEVRTDALILGQRASSNRNRLTKHWFGRRPRLNSDLIA